MEVFIVVFVGLLLFVLLCVALFANAFVSLGSSSPGDVVYIMRVSPNGDVKLKKYHGRVRHWSEVDDL